MTIKEIVETCGIWKSHEVRALRDDYCELVLSDGEDGWIGTLIDILGSPVKTPGREPSEEHLRLAENFGGIRINQTLWRKRSDDSTIIAMLWPWQDQTHTTVKLAVLRD
jgi:hypothetical protein